MDQKRLGHRGSRKLKDNAATLRRQSTGPERRLWSMLRSRQLDGLKFRRQQIIGHFIVDFYCAEQQLVIELDGESHVGRGDQDRKRDEVLQANGIRVLRVTNDDVMRDADAVLRAILHAVGREA